MKDIELWQGDCLELMSNIPDKSVDCIITDLPFGQTQRNRWDCVIPFNDYVLINDKVYYENDYLLYAMGTSGKSFEYNRDWFVENKQIGLWSQYKRITKDNAAIILFGNGMFTADLMESNKPMWKYNIIWEKTQPTGFLNAKKMPLRNHEDICIFYKKPPTYNPQKTTGHPRKVSKAEHKVGCKSTTDYGEHGLTTYDSTERYPKSVWKFAKDIQKCALHPTQKPLALIEELVKTYTNAGDLILDSCMGSGTCGVAAKKLGRKFIGIEKESQYFEISKNRIQDIVV